MTQYLLVLPDGSELSAGTPGQNALRSLQWTHTLNAGTDLTPGSACADSLEAELWVEPGRSPGIAAGQEVTLYRVDGTAPHQTGYFRGGDPHPGQAQPLPASRPTTVWSTPSGTCRPGCGTGRWIFPWRWIPLCSGWRMLRPAAVL